MRVDGQFVKLFVKRLSPFAGLPMLKVGRVLRHVHVRRLFFLLFNVP